MENIAGTRVPDTPIHRASLWLEEVKYPGNRGEGPGVEVFEDELLDRFIEGCGLKLTREQMSEAANYYGTNMLRMTVGDRVQFLVSSPAGEGGFMDSRAIFCSLWLDAFMHGAATAVGKSGKSRAELA